MIVTVDERENSILRTQLLKERLFQTSVDAREKYNVPQVAVVVEIPAGPEVVEILGIQKAVVEEEIPEAVVEPAAVVSLGHGQLCLQDSNCDTILYAYLPFRVGSSLSDMLRGIRNRTCSYMLCL
jgi:hypothetical protein